MAYFLTNDLMLPALYPANDSVVSFSLADIDDGKKELTGNVFNILDLADSILGLEKMIRISTADE